MSRRFVRVRPYTEAEQQFVTEAESHYFTVLTDDDGAPYALGATRTGGCFSMEVVEERERGGPGSIYRLRDDETGDALPTSASPTKD